MSFHEIRFPTDISLASNGGPERRTDIVTLGSGHEERNARWADSRRVYNAGYGVRTLDQLLAVASFFEERRGRLYGFRWRDPLDHKSCPPSQTPAAADQRIGTGDGSTTTFQLSKTYGQTYAPYARTISKPVSGTVLVAVSGTVKSLGSHVTLDISTGRLMFLPGHIPPAGAAVTAGFEFDVPVRFDTDKLDISVRGFNHGAIPDIPIVEIRL